MKLAILSESPADEAAVRVLVDAILEGRVRVTELVSIRAVDWVSIPRILPGAIKGLWYRTDVERLAVVADSNDSPAHSGDHEESGRPDPRCRWCTLRAIVDRARGELRALRGRGVLRIGVGLAVPAIEAWYLCGKDSGVGESNWARGQGKRRLPFTRSALKVKVYGGDRPALDHETRCAVAYAEKLKTKLDRLEKAFPTGFGHFVKEVRSWGDLATGSGE